MNLHPPDNPDKTVEALTKEGETIQRLKNSYTLTFEEAWKLYRDSKQHDSLAVAEKVLELGLGYGAASNTLLLILDGYKTLLSERRIGEEYVAHNLGAFKTSLMCALESLDGFGDESKQNAGTLIQRILETISNQNATPESVLSQTIIK